MKYNVVSQRCLGLDKPVKARTVIPAVKGGDGDYSDEVTLEPGQWLEIISYGSPTDWSKAVVRGDELSKLSNGLLGVKYKSAVMNSDADTLQLCVEEMSRRNVAVATAAAKYGRTDIPVPFPAGMTMKQLGSMPC